LDKSCSARLILNRRGRGRGKRPAEAGDHGEGVEALVGGGVLVRFAVEPAEDGVVAVRRLPAGRGGRRGIRKGRQRGTW
jgi:hypothetical protein